MDGQQQYCNVSNSYFFEKHDNDIYLRTVTDVIITLYIRPILTIFGLIVNTAFLFVLYRVPSMRTVTNFYLANLAIADAIFLLTNSWWFIWEYMSNVDLRATIYGSHINCTYLYKSTLYIIYMDYFASVNFISAVTTERYIALSQPLRHRNWSTKIRTISVVFLCWLLACFLACPVLFITYKPKSMCVAYQDSKAEIGYAIVRWTFCETRSCEWCGVSIGFLDLFQFSFALVSNAVMYFFIVKS